MSSKSRFTFRELNVNNVAQLYNAVKQNVANFRYSSWMRSKVVPISKTNPYDEILCGTSCCIGGWCVFLEEFNKGDGKTLINKIIEEDTTGDESNPINFQERAEEWLGIEQWVGEWLFFGKKGFGFTQSNIYNHQAGLDRLSSLYGFMMQSGGGYSFDINDPRSLLELNLTNSYYLNNFQIMFQISKSNSLTCNFYYLSH